MQQQQVHPQQYQQPVMQQQFVTPQPTVTIVAQNAQPSDDKFQPNALSQMTGLSITQLVMGILCVIFGSVLLAVETSGSEFIYSGAAFCGCGIWIGVYFILLGGIGLGAVKSNTSCWIISAMVLNIISSCSFWVILLSSSSVGIVITEVERCANNYYHGEICDTSATPHTLLALNSLMLIMAIVELVISIWTAVLCCGAVCRCCKGSQGQVVSYSNGQMPVQHQVMVIPSVPSTASYGVYSNSVQDGGQTQYAAQPVGVHPPPNGFAPPQQPPSYASIGQPSTVENPSLEPSSPNTQPPAKY